MQQHLINGLKLKARYVDELKLVNATYSPYDIHIRSALHDRCLQSAAADFAGFYSDSKFHPQGGGWPKNWTPLPIHTNTDPDHEFEPDAPCARAKQIENERLARPEYLNYEQQHIDIVQAFAKGTGEPWTKWWDIIQYVGTLVCENAHGLTLPSFVTPQLYNDTISIRSTIIDYTAGMAILQALQNPELIRLRAGVLIKTLTGLFRAYTDEKLYAYSVHDSTISATLYALGVTAKMDVIGAGQPGYAATLIFELWKMDDGSLAIKLLYANTAEEALKTVTSSIQGCAGKDLCPLATVRGIMDQFVVQDIDKACQAQ
ncbi:unnamed protein product, partial [Mesorhabditis belari]|uniref:Uncharacterized protein n=1 Tax=Mesorhabditis belari TaxID=2138241 RepID=A0AAF3EE58_9BILA